MQSRMQYLVLRNLLPHSNAVAMETLIKQEGDWKRYEEWCAEWVTCTYEKRHAPCTDASLESLRIVGRNLVEREFDAVVGEHHKIVGHKMLPGDFVDIHNDSPKNSRGRAAQFRLLYYPNQETDSVGGDLLLYTSQNRSTLVERLPPQFNLGVLLRLSDSSYHAVTTIMSGVRLSVIVSYWAYPILHKNGLQGSTICRCLRRIISAGLEERKHGATTLARHLYHTYELLARWRAPYTACLAGLMYGVLCHRNPGTLPADTDEKEVEELVGKDAFLVIRALSDTAPGVRCGHSELARDARLIELAALLEQAETEEDLARARELLEYSTDIDPTILASIEFEIATLRTTACRKGSFQT